MSNDEALAIADTAYRTEVCKCGNPRKLHADNLAARGHGGILGKCAKFTWDGKSGPLAVTQLRRN